MTAPRTKEEWQARVKAAIDKSEHKPLWLKKRAQRSTEDYARTWNQQQIRKDIKSA